MHLFDIVIFALITFFFIQRLKSVLGQRVEIDRDTSEPVSEKSTRRQSVIEVTEQDTLPPLQISKTAESEVLQLQKWDKKFNIEDFYTGSVKAFRMILKAYAEGHIPPLAFLSTPEVLQKFTQNIEDRRRKQLTQFLEIVGFLKVSIENITITNSTVSITVHFLTEQTNVTKNTQEDVVAGTLNLIEEIEDVWTFQKDKTAVQDIWKLSAIQSQIK